MDLKRDLVRAIELNESVLDLDQDIKDIHLNIICEIRARLLEGNKPPSAGTGIHFCHPALKKANQCNDQNLELLATIAQLKNEIHSISSLSCRKEEVCL